MQLSEVHIARIYSVTLSTSSFRSPFSPESQFSYHRSISILSHGVNPKPSSKSVMAPRNHTTDLGCIACDDLTEFGAGKEGWLVDNPNLLTALDTHSLAIANRSVVLVLEWSHGAPWIKIRPDLSPIEAEYISAIEWLVFDEIRVLALGTSCGYLLIYSLQGDLIHKQVAQIPFSQHVYVKCITGRIVAWMW